MADEQAPAEQAETEAAPPADDLAGLDADALRQLVNEGRGKIRSLETKYADASSEAAAFRHEKNELKRKHETQGERTKREMEERLRAEIEAEYAPRLAASDHEVRMMRAERRASAFADPQYAVWLAERSNPEVFAESDQGKFEAAIDRVLAALLTANPELGRDRQNHRPLVSQGARSEQAGKPRQRSWLRG